MAPLTGLLYQTCPSVWLSFALATLLDRFHPRAVRTFGSAILGRPEGLHYIGKTL
jgi:hypothetical protein